MYSPYSAGQILLNQGIKNAFFQQIQIEGNGSLKSDQEGQYCKSEYTISFIGINEFEINWQELIL